MTIIKRLKNTRQRAGTTHGGGSMKKRRGAGHRGGRGAAGSGKRADTKKPSIWKGKYFGKSGFSSKSRTPQGEIITLKTLEDVAAVWAETGKAEKKGDIYFVNLKILGYQKLLGTGRLTKKFNIVVPTASASAVARVQHAGGTIEVLP